MGRLVIMAPGPAEAGLWPGLEVTEAIFLLEVRGEEGAEPAVEAE